MEKKCHHCHRRNGSYWTIVFAILLILAGALYLLFDMGILSPVYKPILFSWQMLLIIIGVFNIIRRQAIAGIILAGIGVFFLLPVVGNVLPGFNYKLYWPQVLIVVGIIIIVRQLFFKSKRRHLDDVYFKMETENISASENREDKRTFTEQTGSDKIEKNVAFGSSEQIVFSQDFQGGEVNVAFGELKLDLRKAKLSEGNYLEANVCFGNIELYVPAGWKVNLKSETFLGNIQDSRNFTQQEEDSSLPALNLKAAAFFGNIEIKY